MCNQRSKNFVRERITLQPACGATSSSGAKSPVLNKSTSPLEGEVCFQCEDMSIRKQGEGLIQYKTETGKWKIFTCHTALDAVSQELLSSSTEGRRSSLSEAVKLQMRGVGSSLRRDFVMLNLFQHLTSLACSLFTNKILKQVQDDTIRNFRNEPFNHSPLQPFNSCESSPHPNLAPSWFLLKERERAWIFYTSLKDDCKKERENPVTNLTPQHLNVLTPLFQCKTWRTLPC